MLIKIWSWLHQPKVWRFVCFASSIVGLICYALSSSFNHLLGNWTWWKLLLYIVFGFLISLSTLFAKTWEYSNSRCLEAHTAFSVLLITSVYSFFLDKYLKQKADAYSLLSCVAFAIMSLGLSRLSQLGFEVDLLYFFCALLMVQLMKIKLWLVTVGGAFSYSLILLRSNLDLQPRSGYHGLQHQDHVVLEIGSFSQPQGTSNSVTQVDSTRTIMASSPPHPVIDMVWPSRGTRHSASLVFSPQEGGSGGGPPENIYGTEECFMGCIEALKKENGRVIRAISMHVDKYLKASVLSEEHISVPELHGDDNMVVDSLSSGMIIKLRESVDKMVSDGFEEECLHVYSNWRRKFLKESLWALGLQDQELNGEDINKSEKIERLIKAMNIAARILFPNEERLFYRVFRGSIFNGEFHFRELCTELATSLLNSALALETWSHFLRNTLEELIQEFESFTTLINIVVLLIKQRLCIYEALEDISLNPGGGIHPITLEGMYCIYLVYRNREIRKLRQDLKEGTIPASLYIDKVRILLQSSLDEKSKNGNKFEVLYYIKSQRRSRENKLRLGLDEMISPVLIYRMIELLESSLEANSKNYKNPSLGYVFIMNNRRFIEVETKLNGLGLAFGDDWLHKNTTKFQENLELYLRSSWNKIVDLLKVDINQLEPSVTVELMKDNLYWFNEHFDETCNIQSAWPVCDEELREQIIKSIENMLLPAYGSFLGTFEEFVGKHAYRYIKYGMFEVQDRLNKLFLLRE
ncbi:Exocyst complex component [Vigna angularis]|uniref:Exocyst subunit Exo70 family protein n=1 Tax=Phaseolus angularis TaxID=3914 RepID=A0A8T0K635_PHAAN|nr:exocyst complex component EXO70B1-like [Vigna angularis]KAG2391483.1 Exocyst complex component [Vigna angularis]